ncbi:MAG: LptF/LptG family permease [bacterium]|nr:LptF/LptG family permease [bacterium]
MKLLIRSILREFISITFLVLFLFTAVFIIFATKRIFDVIDLIFNRDVGLLTILKIFGLLLPYVTSLTLPISLLVAGLVVFGRLVLDREWLAFQTSGISPGSVIVPLLILGIILSGGLMYSAEYVVPKCYRQARHLIYNAVNNITVTLKENTFNPIGNNVVLYYRTKTEADGIMHNIIVLYSEEKKLRRLFLAPRGKVSVDPKLGLIRLTLEHGMYHETVPTDSTVYYIGQFTKYEQNIAFTELLAQTEKLQLGPKEMQRVELITEINNRKAKNLPTERLEYELAQRPAKSFGAFIFVLLGIPLGIFWPRFGKSLGMAIELGFALCIPYFYYAIMTLGEDLARGKIIPFWFGAWLPNMTMGIIGLILLFQSCRQK